MVAVPTIFDVLNSNNSQDQTNINIEINTIEDCIIINPDNNNASLNSSDNIFVNANVDTGLNSCNLISNQSLKRNYENSDICPIEYPLIKKSKLNREILKPLGFKSASELFPKKRKLYDETKRLNQKIYKIKTQCKFLKNNSKKWKNQFALKYFQNFTVQ